MTMPEERTRAVLQTRAFLRELMDSAETPGVPAEIRAQARALLRHFPNLSDLQMAHHHCPDRFGAVPGGPNP